MVILRNKKSIWEKLNVLPKRSNSRPGLGILRKVSPRPKRSQFQIQQMAFMIVAIVIFFVLVGLFFLMYQSASLKGSFAQLQRDKAISALSILSNMPEITCGDLCVDVDKVESILNKDYSGFWNVASVKIYKVSSSSESVVKCPAPNCNYWEIYDSEQKNIKEFSSYVSLCRMQLKQGSIYEKCDIGKLVVGVIE